jgi:hypothetical protein
MSNWLTLFDGASLDGWQAAGPSTWQLASAVALRPDDPHYLTITPGQGLLVNGPDGRTSDIRTSATFGSCELHVEFCVSAKSNSGVYLLGQYEIQILDSWGTPDSELVFGTCGGIYARWIDETKSSYDGHAPRTNASRRPGEWQSFDVLFHAPEFDASGHQLTRASFERVVHNGIVIHEHFTCSGPTRGAWQPHDIPTGPLRLQGDHGPVAFRNVRLRPLADV